LYGPFCPGALKHIYIVYNILSLNISSINININQYNLKCPTNGLNKKANLQNGQEKIHAVDKEKTSTRYWHTEATNTHLISFGYVSDYLLM